MNPTSAEDDVCSNMSFHEDDQDQVQQIPDDPTSSAKADTCTHTPGDPFHASMQSGAPGLTPLKLTPKSPPEKRRYTNTAKLHHAFHA